MPSQPGDPQTAPTEPNRAALRRRINLLLATLGEPTCAADEDGVVLDAAADLVRLYRERERLLSHHHCPADTRIVAFLDAYLAENGVDARCRLPTATLVLDHPGMARELSLPRQGNTCVSPYLESYRVPQGVLHNPRNDRRTTKGVFHVVGGGLPVPADKKAVPVAAFARLLAAALDPPAELQRLPYTSAEPSPARAWVSLYLRPLVSPEVSGFRQAQTMETRVFAPGSLVANLDFLERIFGNAGNPHFLENDAAQDVLHWCGTSGCVILAPHLVGQCKRDLGLPHHDQASPRQRRDGMCWRDPGELYNEGKPFKLVCRDRRGVIVTLIADNYFGYSKKEIKSQISYSANLCGGCEEEHAGGALCFPRQDLGDSFQADGRVRSGDHSFADVCRLHGDRVEVHDAGYAVDRRYPDVLYVPEDARFELTQQRISWIKDGQMQELALLAGHCYLHPSGYRISLEKDERARAWRLVGTEAEGLLMHRPCTVSGGGKSEIAKSISGSILHGPVYVRDIHADLDRVDEILRRDFSRAYRQPRSAGLDLRALLSPLRSVNSVIRLLTPSAATYTDEYNAWVEGIPQYIRGLVVLVKRYYDPEWEEDWQRYFSVDIINGLPSHELRFRGRKLIAGYFRVGYEDEGAWRVFKLRQDFVPAERLQVEDDITASTCVPEPDAAAKAAAGLPACRKYVANCERELFQRPDDVRVRGADAQTERDLAGANNFITNFQPLTAADAIGITQDVVAFDQFTAPMRDLIRRATALTEGEYFVSSAHPRLVDGRPSPNVRYLQRRPDLVDPRCSYIAEVGVRLARRVPADRPISLPVDSVLTGRRSNPPDRAAGIRSLSVYSPLHYQELPELFMDFVASLSGKSPSTTGAGSEGAMTKGPFNALPATADLNTALVSYILCGHHGFSTAAGHIGPGRRVDHDITQLLPEVWCRLPARCREPSHLIERGYLERVEDFVHRGRHVLASRLGYRITAHFVHAYFGNVFEDPGSVFDEAMLRPETQDLEAFVDGVCNIVEAQAAAASAYLDDGSVGDACPPLEALLHIMARGSYQGLGVADPAFRRLFTAAYLLDSDWYQERLDLQQRRDVALWRRHVAYLERVLYGAGVTPGAAADPGLEQRLLEARRRLAEASSPTYRAQLVGSLGADWLSRRDRATEHALSPPAPAREANSRG